MPRATAPSKATIANAYTTNIWPWDLANIFFIDHPHAFVKRNCAPKSARPFFDAAAWMRSNRKPVSPAKEATGVPRGGSGIFRLFGAFSLPVVGKRYNRSGGNATACSAKMPRCGWNDASEAISARNRAKRRGGTSMPPRPRFYRGRGVIDLGEMREGLLRNWLDSLPEAKPLLFVIADSVDERLLGKVIPSRVLAGRKILLEAL